MCNKEYSVYILDVYIKYSMEYLNKLRWDLLGSILSDINENRRPHATTTFVIGWLLHPCMRKPVLNIKIWLTEHVIRIGTGIIRNSSRIGCWVLTIIDRIIRSILYSYIRYSVTLSGIVFILIICVSYLVLGLYVQLKRKRS